MPVRHPAENLELLKFVFDAMPGPVENFIIGFRIFDVAAGGDAGFTTLAAKLIAMSFAIISLVSHPSSVPQVCGEFGGGRVITDVSRC